MEGGCADTSSLENCTIALTDPYGNTSDLIQTDAKIWNSWQLTTPYSDCTIGIAYSSKNASLLPWNGEYKLEFKNKIVAKYFVNRGRNPLNETASPELRLSSPNKTVAVTPEYKFQLCLKVLAYRNVSFETALNHSLILCDKSPETAAQCNITDIRLNEQGKYVLTLSFKNIQLPLFRLKCYPTGRKRYAVSLFSTRNKLGCAHTLRDIATFA